MSVVTTAICVILLVYGASKGISLERTDLKDFRRFHLLDNRESQDPDDPRGIYSQRRLQKNVSTSEVSIQPSSSPSSAPLGQSSSSNSSAPSGQPSSVPSSVPSSLPSSQPSSQPTSVPSSSDTSAPTGQPTSSPTNSSSIQPTRQPSTQEYIIINKSSRNDRKVSDGGVVGIFFACLIFIGAIGGAAYYYKYRKIYNPLNEPNKGMKSQLSEDDFVLHSFYN
jgi:hypothetical protein